MSPVSFLPDTFSYVSPTTPATPMAYPSATTSSSPMLSDLPTSPDILPYSSLPISSPRLVEHTPLPQRTSSRTSRRNLAFNARYSSQPIQQSHLSTLAGNLPSHSTQQSIVHITEDSSNSILSLIINRLRSNKRKKRPWPDFITHGLVWPWLIFYCIHI